ncbi:hypothetical protein BN2476_920011 [Paraburkholderia piptadeniae]|uniref:Uncharacterized protein n=1 Tax=Paraburkholderia piptadeniae TaxID=1701573 RepID=A0A1N7STP0_9BURK|nr:hypothetical protein BN2476_920011 [Paraburkholderia piptadeniae]
MAVHSPATPSKDWRTEPLPTHRPFLRLVQKSGQRIMSDWQRVRRLLLKPTEEGQQQSLPD